MNTNFFLQLIQRIASESPKFFVIIRWIAGVLGALSGAASFLVSHAIWQPSFAAQMGTITTAVYPILTAIWAMSLLPVKDASGTGLPPSSKP